MPSEGRLNSQYVIATPLVRLIPWIIHLTPMVNIPFQIIGYQIEKNMKLPKKNSTRGLWFSYVPNSQSKEQGDSQEESTSLKNIESVRETKTRSQGRNHPIEWTQWSLQNPTLLSLLILDPKANSIS